MQKIRLELTSTDRIWRIVLDTSIDANRQFIAAPCNGVWFEGNDYYSFDLNADGEADFGEEIDDRYWETTLFNRSCTIGDPISWKDATTDWGEVIFRIASYRRR